MRGRPASVLALALGCALGGAARADVAETKSAAPERSSLRERTGIAWAERALRESNPLDRERALDRLSALRTPRALELLVKALEPNGFAQTPRERLLAVRGASASAREPRVRESLMRVMTGISAAAERSDPLQGLLRDTAALALAQSGEPLALTALARALRQPGRVAEAARRALVAHPPRDLHGLIRAHGAPTLELARVLGELDDQRAFQPLRSMLERGSPELRIESALALTRLGDFEVVELAQKWARDLENSQFSPAAAEILSLARAPGAANAVRALLADEATRELGLSLARHSPDVALEPELVRLAEAAAPGELSLVLAALASSRGKLALQALERFASRAEAAELAAQALSRAPHAAARELIQRLLGRGATRRLAARAGLVRAVTLGDPPAGLERTLEALLESELDADRAVGAFGVARLAPERARELVWSSDPVVAEAAARAAPFVGAAVTAADRLSRVPPGRLRTQLALALVEPRARDRVPTGVLIELVEEQGLAAPLALYALAERDSEALRGRLLEQLASPDPWLRAQVALGLGASESPSALGLLEAAYRFEADPAVRRALVYGAARRGEGARCRTLALAAALDPDPSVRTLGRQGLTEGASDPWATGPSSWFAVLERNDGAGRGALVTVPGGLSVPVLADPDGVVLLSGLAGGPLEVRVALLPGGGKSPSRGAP